MLANFIVVMKPPLDCNPWSRMWTLLTINQIICSKLLKWLKLVELSMAMVLGSVEDERCFSNLSIIKIKLRNWLIAHLDLVVWMYAQSFYIIKTFMFTITIKSWNHQKDQRVVNAQWTQNLHNKLLQQSLNLKPCFSICICSLHLLGIWKILWRASVILWISEETSEPPILWRILA
jgi:hypothetical protein